MLISYIIFCNCEDCLALLHFGKSDNLPGASPNCFLFQTQCDLTGEGLLNDNLHNPNLKRQTWQRASRRMRPSHSTMVDTDWLMLFDFDSCTTALVGARSCTNTDGRVVASSGSVELTGAAAVHTLHGFSVVRLYLCSSITIHHPQSTLLAASSAVEYVATGKERTFCNKSSCVRVRREFCQLLRPVPGMVMVVTVAGSKMYLHGLNPISLALVSHTPF